MISPAGAEEAETPQLAARSVSIPLHPLRPDSPGAEAKKCIVAGFGEVAKRDEATPYFARCHDRRRPVPEEIATDTEFASVLVKADSLPEEDASVVHVRKPGVFDCWDTFLALELIQSGLGSNLDLPGTRLGDGCSQHDYDEYRLGGLATGQT